MDTKLFFALAKNPTFTFLLNFFKKRETPSFFYFYSFWHLEIDWKVINNKERAL